MDTRLPVLDCRKDIPAMRKRRRPPNTIRQQKKSSMIDVDRTSNIHCDDDICGGISSYRRGQRLGTSRRIRSRDTVNIAPSAMRSWFIVALVGFIVPSFLLSLKTIQYSTTLKGTSSTTRSLLDINNMPITTSATSIDVYDTRTFNSPLNVVNATAITTITTTDSSSSSSSSSYSDGQQQQQPLKVCFITAQFSTSINNTDRLFNVRQMVPDLYNSESYTFFVFTNLDDLNAPDGWNVILRKDLEANYSRHITQSRWPKFQALKDTTIRQSSCHVVFYIDGIIIPQNDPAIFQQEAHRIYDNDDVDNDDISNNVGFAQRIHPDGGGAEGEFRRIKRRRKDTVENVRASIRWLQNQADYDTKPEGGAQNCTLYENSMFGYSTKSHEFQRAADFFWNIYEKETLSWRDQPLWCYVLKHLNITPLQLTDNGSGRLFRKDIRLMARKGAHRYVPKKRKKTKKRKRKNQ